MHFQSIAKALVFLTAGLTSAVFVPGGLPDGQWKGEQFANGTTITTCLSDPAIPPIIQHHDPPRSIKERSIEERGSNGDCWGYFLDHASVDTDNRDFQNQVANGLNFCSGGTNAWTGRIINSVLVYFCADQPNECLYLNAGTIQQGMGLMDAICPPYEAGWALFPNTGGRFIMGKCVINSNICV